MSDKEPAVFLEDFIGKEFQPSDELNKLVYQWLDLMNDTTKIIIEFKYGLNGKRKLPVKQIMEVINKKEENAYWHITPSRINKRLRDERVRFLSACRVSKLSEVAIAIAKMRIINE